eukprot:1195162-Prorocentrum_minimum.AAC.3
MIQTQRFEEQKDQFNLDAEGEEEDETTFQSDAYDGKSRRCDAKSVRIGRKGSSLSEYIHRSNEARSDWEGVVSGILCLRCSPRVIHNEGGLCRSRFHHKGTHTILLRLTQYHNSTQILLRLAYFYSDSTQTHTPLLGFYSDFTLRFHSDSHNSTQTHTLLDWVCRAACHLQQGAHKRQGIAPPFSLFALLKAANNMYYTNILVLTRPHSGGDRSHDPVPEV